MTDNCKTCEHAVYDTLFHCYECKAKDKYVHVLKTAEECNKFSKKHRKFFGKKPKRKEDKQ